MATANVRNILKIPGRLIKDPTNLAAASPYGGTELGLASSILFKPRAKHVPITAEEFGGAVAEVLYGGDSCLLAATLRGLDNDAASAVFVDTATGSPSGDTVPRSRAATDATRAGIKLSANSLTLLFAPKAPLRQPAILIRDAIPVITEETEIALSQGAEFSVPVLFYGIPDGSNRSWEIAKLKDITL